MSTAVACSTSPYAAHPIHVEDDGDLHAHMQALGLISRSAYLLWRRRHDFPMDLVKSAAERAREIEFLQRRTEPDDAEADPDHDPRR